MKMNKREELWDEVKSFCEYIGEWFPNVREIRLFGSCLWKDEPSDIDVIIVGGNEYLFDAYKTLFPYIHLHRKMPPNNHLINKPLLWTWQKGLLHKELPQQSKEEVLQNEIKSLRNQLDFLKTRVRGHETCMHIYEQRASKPCRPRTPTYNPYWMLTY